MSVASLPSALQGCDQVLRGLRVGGLARPVATLLGDVLELADDAVDLVIGHSPDQRCCHDANDFNIVSGVHDPHVVARLS